MTEGRDELIDEQIEPFYKRCFLVFFTSHFDAKTTSIALLWMSAQGHLDAAWYLSVRRILFARLRLHGRQDWAVHGVCLSVVYVVLFPSRMGVLQLHALQDGAWHSACPSHVFLLTGYPDGRL
jgi:hypothetical protein